jgi:hypothetical protein
MQHNSVDPPTSCVIAVGFIITWGDVRLYLLSDDDDDLVDGLCFRLTLTSLTELWAELLGDVAPRPDVSSCCCCCCCCWDRVIRDLRLKKPTTIIRHQKNQMRCGKHSSVCTAGPCICNRVSEGKRTLSRQRSGEEDEQHKCIRPKTVKKRRICPDPLGLEGFFKSNVLNYRNNYQLSHGRFNPLKTEFLNKFIYKFSPYLTGNTLCLRYKAQPVNAV